jgi:hypothetical protein
MELIKRVKLHFFKKQLLKEQEGFVRQRQKQDTVKTIGIIFDATSPEHRDIINKFVDDLRSKGKKVRLLAFFNDKHPHEGTPYPYFNLKELNWFGVPKPEVAPVYEFIKQPFDMLYSLYFNEVVALDFITALNKANFKTGVTSLYHQDMDLGVDMNGKTDLKLLLQQIKFYLNKINQKYESLVEI